MDKIIDKLMMFGLTKTESLTYIYFLKNGVSSGYKIAKEMSISRSSVYQAIDSLYSRGYLLLVPSKSKEYKAKDPELLLEELESKYIENTKFLKDELKNFKDPEEDNYFYNVEGFENIISKGKAIINSSEREIYINTDIDLKEILPELKSAKKRGVRIIIFSFDRQNTYGLDLELYYEEEELIIPRNTRLMIVNDTGNSLVATTVTGESLIGNYSNNAVYSKIIAEHIHHDVYLSRLHQKYGKDFLNLTKIDTLYEKEGRKNMEK